jgi:hypothetical protein
MCRLSRNLGASTSWNPKGLSRPVMGLLWERVVVEIICKNYYSFSYYYYIMSRVTGLVSLVLLLYQRWSPPLRHQDSDCSTFRLLQRIYWVYSLYGSQMFLQTFCYYCGGSKYYGRNWLEYVLYVIWNVNPKMYWLLNARLNSQQWSVTADTYTYVRF